MTILRPGKKRRDPLGGHHCFTCECQFVVQHADRLPEPYPNGDIFMPCPECGALVRLNSHVISTPAP